MKTIEINKEIYVAKAGVDKALKGKKITPTKIQIVVLQRGWIAVGRLSQTKDQCTLTDAFIVRRWGTENGLGELAANGPLPSTAPNGPTTLDKSPDIRFHEMTAVLRMDVDESKWQSVIA